MSNVAVLNMVTRLPIPTERVLSSALENGMDTVVVIGWDNNKDFYFASSEPSGPEVVWLLEVAKKRLIEIAEAEE